MDGSWTIVVIDAAEATPHRRALLRQELAWAGFGGVGPNVLASPVVAAEVAARVVEHVGGFANVLVSRATVVETAGTLGADDLAHRVAALDQIADRYSTFVDRFERFRLDPPTLDPELAFKLRTLLVAEFRRIALADPQLPPQLLPEDWIGGRARQVAAAVYSDVVESAEVFLASTADPLVGTAPDLSHRFSD